MGIALPASLRANGYRPGLYSYVRQTAEERTRVHLRVQPDEKALLLINANRAVHLNPTAAFMAWLFLEGVPERQAVQRICRRYRASRRQARSDFEQFSAQIEALLKPEGVCLIHDVELELMAPFSSVPSAPYRMDLALTYRCNDNCPHCYNARPRNYPELSTDEWKRILDTLWEIGIPHIAFTGGEATLRDDLPELIAHAEDLGQITGLLTNGRRLSDQRYLDRLLEAGLDHVQITLESHDEQVHDLMVATKGAWKQTVAGIQNCVQSGVYVMTNTTLLTPNAPSIGETMDFLADIGVPTVGCNALIYSGKGKKIGNGLPEEDLAPLLKLVRRKTEDHGQRLIWYTPTQYCHFDPVQMELGVKGCTAARYNMCVEPDGGVIPCQSFYEQVGNILRDPWDSIWNHERSLWLRERRYLPRACEECAVLAECGGGCPLTLMNQPEQQPLPDRALPLNVYAKG